jgi:hypothetical protein
MKLSQREHLMVLLFGLLAGCEKDAIKAEKPKPGAAMASAAAKSIESARVDAQEVTPASSASAKKKEKTCAPGGCAPGKCG